MEQESGQLGQQPGQLEQQPDRSEWAGKKVFLTISNPHDGNIFEKEYFLDAFGGFSDKIKLDRSAPLGNYNFYLTTRSQDGPRFDACHGTIQLEEYKKPEFEVTVETPKEPVRSGQKIRAIVRAKYYFGAPVTDATVKYRVLMKKQSGSWYPVRSWDWLYGNGYSWFAPDYQWYPRWSDWGCPAPKYEEFSSFFYESPKLLTKGTAKIGPNGTVEIPLDTENVKFCDAGFSRNYEIIAEVTDSSRRMVSGEGSVLVTPDPVKVHVWLDRGFYQSGNQIQASVQTRRIDGSPISGRAEMKVYRVEYAPEKSDKKNNHNEDKNHNVNLNHSVNQNHNADQKITQSNDKITDPNHNVNLNHNAGKNHNVNQNHNADQNVISNGENQDAKFPTETEIYATSLTLGDDGRGELLFKAPKTGQYRFSCVVTDSTGHQSEGGYLFNVRSVSDSARSDFHYNDLELIPEKAEYAPGEKARFLINTEKENSTVLLFLRSQKEFRNEPRIIRMSGKSQVVEIEIEKDDIPNIHVEALTISRGRVHTAAKDLVVPPEKKILNLTIIPSREKYRPGEKVKADLLVTDQQGKPVTGQLVVTVYDKSVEYFSDGSNIKDIRNFFWKWRRSFQPSYNQTNLMKICSHFTMDKIFMETLGIFGDLFLPGHEHMRNYKERIGWGIGGGIGGGFGGAMMPGGPWGGYWGGPKKTTDSETNAAIPESNWSDFGMNEELLMMMTNQRAERKGKMLPDGAMIDPTIRKRFADTAFWIADLTADQKGRAGIEFEMPENLTTWKIRAWVMTAGTRVGEGTTEILTGKDLLVRMQKPRFLIQNDQVVFSALVHNYLSSEKETEISLELPFAKKRNPLALERDQKKVQKIRLAPKSEKRIDWHLRAEEVGTATVRMLAKTDEESDAVEETISISTHGMIKQQAVSGMIDPNGFREDVFGNKKTPSDDSFEKTTVLAKGKKNDNNKTTVQDDNNKTITAEFVMTLPEKRRKADSRLLVRFSPSLAGTMLEAIPYLVEYPYGCTEQTLNRFVPLVIAQNVLQKTGVDLGDLKKKNGQAASWNKIRQEEGDKRAPVFDKSVIASMTEAGLDRLKEMQRSDGGWGWFSGEDKKSDPHLTAQVVHGLILSRNCDVDFERDDLSEMFYTGLDWLKFYQRDQAKKFFLANFFLTIRNFSRNGRTPGKLTPMISTPSFFSFSWKQKWKSLMTIPRR